MLQKATMSWHELREQPGSIHTPAALCGHFSSLSGSIYCFTAMSADRLVPTCCRPLTALLPSAPGGLSLLLHIDQGNRNRPCSPYFPARTDGWCNSHAAEGLWSHPKTSLICFNDEMSHLGCIRSSGRGWVLPWKCSTCLQYSQESKKKNENSVPPDIRQWCTHSGQCWQGAAPASREALCQFIGSAVLLSSSMWWALQWLRQGKDGVCCWRHTLTLLHWPVHSIFWFLVQMSARRNTSRNVHYHYYPSLLQSESRHWRSFPQLESKMYKHSFFFNRQMC